MSLVSDVGSLVVLDVGVHGANSILKSGLKKRKGWHGEALRHSEARKTYYKNGKKLPLPKWAKKGKTYTMNGKKNTFLTFK